MPPKINPLPELIPNRIMMLRDKLRATLWIDQRSLDAVISPVINNPITVSAAQSLSFRPIRPGEYFGEPWGEWQQCWFQVQVPAPASSQPAPRHFFWDCRGESTVYIDGQPWAGLDVAHPSCILPERACTLWIDCGAYQTCIWYDNGKPIDAYGLRFEGAWTARHNPATWETFWDLDVLVQWMTFLLKRDGLSEMVRPWGPFPAPDTAHPILRKLLAMLDEAFMAWEVGGFSALAPALKQIYAAFPAETWQPKVDLIGHSHLDLVWMWPEGVGEQKAVHTIATALRLLEEYPQYRFMWTSPHSMKMLEQRFPALFETVKAQIRAGRWETTGGAWVEFDTLIACGEALGRSLALGQRMMQKLRGETSNTVWLPDCFGFNGFLPQIMAQAGIANFYTAKLSWSSQTRFPYDSFVWRAPDGSEVVTHMNVTTNSWDDLSGMIESASNYRELDVHDEMLKYTGVGDGGGGTTIDKIELFNRLGSLAQVPRVEWGTVEGFFDRLGQQRAKLPVFEGELYLEFHRGIYTTESEFKRSYRRLERALQAWEAARALTGAGPIPESYWERLCFNQFHDALPGSSIKLVYDQQGSELEALGSEALANASAELTQAAGPQPWSVFNPLALNRRMVIELPEGSALDLLEAAVSLPKGLDLPVQTIATPEGGKTLASVALKALSITALENIPPVETRWEISPSVLDNGVLRVEFDGQGQITRISEQGQPWPLAGAPKLVLHPDNPPATFDAWDIDHGFTRQSITTISGAPLRVSERGPVRAALSGQAGLGESSCVQIRYILEAGSAVLRMELDVDWQEEHRILRYYLPTSLRGRSARYGAPYGSLTRPQTPGMPREEAMWEVPASRWAAVTDDRNDGLALISEAKWGFACRDGELAMTLLRAPLDPAMASPQNPRRHRPEKQVDYGPHTIRFAIARYQAVTTAGQLSTPAQAEALYAPVLVGRMAPAAAPFAFAGDLGTLAPTWVLPALSAEATGAGRILRLNETAGASGALTLVFAAAPSEVAVVDFLERPLDSACLKQIDPCRYELAYQPYQLISIRMK